MNSYYEILGVDVKASLDEIKNAYRTLAKKYHPDIFHGSGSEIFKRINEAYAVLGDAENRKKYDESREVVFASLYEQNDSDTFSRNVVVGVSLTADEAASGVVKNITVTRYELCAVCGGTGAKNGVMYVKCSACAGDIRARINGTCSFCKGRGYTIIEPCQACNGVGAKRIKRTMRVTFPKGTTDGQIMHINGEGNSTAAYKSDLVIIVTILAEEELSKHNSDNTITIKVPYTALIFGGKINAVINGETHSIILPERCEDGYVVNLPKPVKTTGDEEEKSRTIKVMADVPKKLSEQQLALIKELHKSFISDKMNNK